MHFSFSCCQCSCTVKPSLSQSLFSSQPHSHDVHCGVLSLPDLDKWKRSRATVHGTGSSLVFECLEGQCAIKVDPKISSTG